MKSIRLAFIVLCFFMFSALQLLAIPLAGSYTINSGLPLSATNFPSFNSFADSINANGISASVSVTVATGSGPYTEQVVFANITGTGPAATVTLDGNGETITAITSTTNRHVVRLSNLQFFTVTNLNILRDAASTSGFYGIHIFGTGSNITISNCHVDMNGTNSTLVGAYIASGSETSILETGDFHNISIINNTSVSGGYGASVFGLISNLASGILISGNVFNDFHSNGVYLRETNGAVVSGNNFDKSTANVTSANAIQIAQAANINAQIFNNIIRVGQISNGNVTFRGIYLFNGTGHRVYNNVIHDINLVSGNVTGIEIRTGATAPEIYFNTIAINNPNPTTGNLYGIKEELSNTNSILRNNLISITQPTSGAKAGLYLGATAVVTSAFNSNYNDIYVPGGNTAVKGSLTPVVYPTLANWQSASGQDANSIVIDPVFFSTALSQPTNVAMDNAGTPITGISTDIVAMPRGPVPDIGAYEFNNTGLPEWITTQHVSIFPNPGHGIYYAFIPGNTLSPVDVKIYDMKGILVYNCLKYGNEVKIELNNFTDGTYSVNFTREQKDYYSRIVLLNLDN